MSMHSSDDAASRYERNQMVRRVLTRYSIDLELLSVSCIRSLVYLNGYLKKGLGHNLKPAEIETVFGEIEKIPWVRGIVADLEDMVVTNNEGIWSVIMKTPSRITSTASGVQDAHRIEAEESVEKTLDDIRKKKG